MAGHVPEKGDYEFAEEIEGLQFWEARPTTSDDQHEATMKHQIATAAATAVDQICEIDDCPADCDKTCALCREYTTWKNKTDAVDRKNSRRKKAARDAGRSEWVREPALGVKMKPRWKKTAAYRAYRLKNTQDVHTSRQNKMGAAFTDLSVG